MTSFELYDISNNVVYIDLIVIYTFVLIVLSSRCVIHYLSIQTSNVDPATIGPLMSSPTVT